jgi:uncharacterized Tic20 family protein
MATPPPASRLRQTGLSTTDRNFAMWIHLSPLLGFPVMGPLAGVVPLVLWLARRDESPFNDDHGREVVNLSITGVLVFFIGLVAMFIGFTGCVGIAIWIGWGVVALISMIRGAVAANSGEYFRYPLNIRFLS